MKKVKSRGRIWGFIVSGTWLPVNHLIGDKLGHLFIRSIPNQIARLNKEKFANHITPEAMHEAIDKLAVCKEVKEVKQKSIQATMDTHCQHEEFTMNHDLVGRETFSCNWCHKDNSFENLFWEFRYWRFLAVFHDWNDIHEWLVCMVTNSTM